MNDEIEAIIPLPLPFDPNDPIFECVDEDGNKYGEPYSYNDRIDKIKSISGVNEDFLGKK